MFKTFTKKFIYLGISFEGPSSCIALKATYSHIGNDPKKSSFRELICSNYHGRELLGLIIHFSKTLFSNRGERRGAETF